MADRDAGQRRPTNAALGRTLAWGVGAVCVLLLVVDLFLHKHGPFPVEHVFGFYAIVGFASSVLLVLAAWVLRRLLNRPEDYYDE